MKLRLGTRSSALARWQAQWVTDRLLEVADVEVELVPISTRGDRDQTSQIGAVGAIGVFTKELQRALLDDRVDLVVHSLKDLPTVPVEGVSIAAVPPRETVADALVSREGRRLRELPVGAKVGTGSQRRRALLLSARSDLDVQPIRGNVDTRLAKLAAGEYDAIVLAEAGLKRLGLEDRATEVLAPPLLLPAVGQGALGIEARSDDRAIRELLARLDDPAAHAAVTAERAMLARLCAGCLAPVGGWARCEAAGQLTLSAVVLSADGATRLDTEACGDVSESEALGLRVAEDLLERGAGALIEAAHDSAS
ncbi:MAG: hydroxymethylbilane synthase [Planctomycetales bacterium]|nr:hydroxymethylbilane synthase [Planctomycetales bacterium]